MFVMANFFKHRALSLALVILLSVLLAVLATLQYHWLGQVSDGERERMRAALHAGAVRFCEDFDRELARVYLNFQIDGPMLRSEKGSRYSERYARWNSTAPFPELVSNVFLVSRDAQSRLQLQQFNKVSQHFEYVAWPLQLEHLRRHFEQLETKSVAESLTDVLGMPPFIDGDPPTVISPVLETLAVEGKSDGVSSLHVPFQRMIKPPSEHIVVALNSDSIRKLLVTLGNRYFSIGNDHGQPEYTMRVVSRLVPQTIIYSSDAPTQVALPSTSDEAINLFSLRPELIGNFSLDGVFPARMPVHEAATGGAKAEMNQGPDALMYANGGALWQLTLRHRDGSLNAVVNRTRQRNMLLSGTILLVLASSMILILVFTQRARKLAQQQIEFVAGVSHELRTPITVITSAADNLSDGLVSEDEQVKRYGSIISGHGRRLGEMVEQVLEFAGTISVQKAYQARETAVSNLIEHALAACQTQISEQGFTVEKEIDLKLPVVVIDSAAMSRAIQNLLSNAMKYSGEKRRIKLSACLNASKRGAEIVIIIEDQGLGIATSHLANIFEPFYRCPEVIAAQIHGNGLGLTLVKRIVEAHGGRISILSRPGEGSAFSLHLPVNAEVANHVGDGKTEGNYGQAYTAC